MSPDPTARREELRERLDATRDRIARAAVAAGREPAELTLVVVTKTYPASDLRLLAGLGVEDVGENRIQEVLAKADEGAYAGLRLHVIGRLQGNKAALAGRYAAMVHSLDRAKLIRPLARGAAEAGRELSVLLQISLDGDPARGGVPREGLESLAEAVLASPLRLAGVMAVPPAGADPAAAFADLAALHERVLALAPEAGVRSAGMSADLEQAIAAGATHLRVGTAILGSRTPLG